MNVSPPLTCDVLLNPRFSSNPGHGRAKLGDSRGRLSAEALTGPAAGSWTLPTQGDRLDCSWRHVQPLSSAQTSGCATNVERSVNM